MYIELKVYTDGGSRGNPGQSAIGIVIFDKNDVRIKDFSSYLGDGITNNQAEYIALLEGLRLAKQLGGKKITCYSDSLVIIKQANGEYKVKNEILKNYYRELKEREYEFKNVKYVHASRTNIKIKMADYLLNKILNSDPWIK